MFQGQTTVPSGHGFSEQNRVGHKLDYNIKRPGVLVPTLNGTRCQLLVDINVLSGKRPVVDSYNVCEQKQKHNKHATSCLASTLALSATHGAQTPKVLLRIFATATTNWRQLQDCLLLHMCANNVFQDKKRCLCVCVYLSWVPCAIFTHVL